jgi:hypothetical protein
MASKLAREHAEYITLYPESLSYAPWWQAEEFAKLWDEHAADDTTGLFNFALLGKDC